MIKQINKNEVRIIVAGSRTFDSMNLSLIRQLTDGIIDALVDGKKSIFDPKIRIISGYAKGIDIMGEEIAKMNNYELSVFPAEWDRYGIRAGYIRNKQMIDFALDALQTYLVVVYDGTSKGTRHMIKECKRLGIEVAYIPWEVAVRQCGKSNLLFGHISSCLADIKDMKRG